MPSPPPVVATIGLHGSASTWVFNVVRELMEAAHGPEAVHSQYADKPELLSETPKPYRVIKCHHGSQAMDEWLAAHEAPLFLSLRDPRDAAISMAQRFKAPLQQTAAWIRNDCIRLTTLAPGCTILLRYEDRFFDKPETIVSLAGKLNISLPAPRLETIFARYRTEAVRDFAKALPHLPPERLTMVGTFQMDKVTQILAPHIGDGHSGKWRKLPAPAPERLTSIFAPFLGQFGYPAE